MAASPTIGAQLGDYEILSLLTVSVYVAEDAAGRLSNLVFIETTP